MDVTEVYSRNPLVDIYIVRGVQTGRQAIDAVLTKGLVSSGYRAVEAWRIVDDAFSVECELPKGVGHPLRAWEHRDRRPEQ